MDIGYQLDPSINNIYRQLSSTSSTANPATTSFSPSERPSLTWSAPAFSTPASRPTSSSTWGSLQVLPPTPAPLDVSAGLVPVQDTASHPAPNIDLQETLNRIRESLQQHQVTSHPAPPVVVINNIPSSSPSGWAVEPDHLAVGGAVAAILLVVLCGGLWWLRKYRPNTWKTVRTHTIRVLRFFALPASWLCGKAAGLLRSFHQDTQVGNFNNITFCSTFTGYT
jgi:hypothetical protein